MAWPPATIPSPSTNVVHVGPFTVHIYGLCYVLAVHAAVAITRRRWAARGGSPELVYDVALGEFLPASSAVRLYFLTTTPAYPSHTAKRPHQCSNESPDDVETVAALKEDAGREISVTGSGTLVRSLLLAGLVDELRLLVHPVVVGRGKHLFENGAEPTGLVLASSKQLVSGVLDPTYRADTQ